MARGVFSLNRVYKKQFQNVNDGNFESWPESATYGYFYTANTPRTVCLFERLDFSTDVVSKPGNNLPQARYGLGATSSSSYGYFGGGINPPSFICTINRLDFSTETTSAPGNNLSVARRYLRATSSSSYGYFAGGDPSGPIIDRLDYSNETTSAPGNNLDTGRRNLAAVSSSSYGYFGGGLTSTPSTSQTCTIDRLDFSNETSSLLGNSLSISRWGLGATSSSSYGYFASGSNPPTPPTITCVIDRLDFSNETVSAPGNNLLQEKTELAAVSSFSYGYFGCYSPSPETYRLDLSNETVLSLGSNLTPSNVAGAAVSGGQSQRPKGSRTYGYFAGGFTPGPGRLCTIDRLDFSNETISALGEKLSQAVSVGTIASSSSYGYYGGGRIPPGNTATCTINRLDFSNESVSALSNTLSEVRDYFASTSSNSYGYFGGGSNGPTASPTYVRFCTIDRLDFSTEVVSAPGNDLLGRKSSLYASSNNSYGYFAGGNDPTPQRICTIDRLDFSNETVSSPGNDLSEARGISSSVFNPNYGYFGGGSLVDTTSLCTIDRLDFSNETVSALVNSLSEPKQNSTATSTNYFGYFVGGFSSAIPGGVNTIERLDFSTETLSTPGSDLLQDTYGMRGVSN